jgi:pyroglutamyl-peptidase
LTETDNSRPAVLLTGFGPFPGVEVNATVQLVSELREHASRRYPDRKIVSSVLSVDWEDGPAQSLQLIERHRPELILHFGVSERARGFVIETQARNACECARDACGSLPASERLDEEAPTVLAATLPCGAIVDRLRRARHPVSLSEDAGGYLCNAVFFRTLWAASPRVRAGFIHVPSHLHPNGARAQNDPSLTMEKAVFGALEIVAACLEA